MESSNLAIYHVYHGSFYVINIDQKKPIKFFLVNIQLNKIMSFRNMDDIFT